MATPGKTMLPPLLLRADADPRQGTGHVMRCLALAEAWNGPVCFATVKPALALVERFGNIGAQVIELPAPHPAADDLARTLKLSSQLEREYGTVPWLVVDGYHFDGGYHQALRRAAWLLVIDDNAHLDSYDAHIVLNHGVHAPRLIYSAGRDTWLLLGSHYALLRGEFQRWCGLPMRPPARARNILVTLGGGDATNATATVIAALQSFPAGQINARVVIGALHPHLADLKRMIKGSTNISLQSNLRDMASAMVWADVAIAAGGTTAWELAAMGVPTLLLVLADNQVAVAQAIDEFGAARNLGWAERISAQSIAQNLRHLIDNPNRRVCMSRFGGTMVDGHGVERVIFAMQERRNFTAGAALTIRDAGGDDSLLLWQWANDPTTRRHSFNSRKIRWAEHEAWFKRKLADDDCRIWIAQLGDLPVGQIRYDRLDNEVAEISFSVAPGFRGMQLGTRMLLVSSELALRELAVRVLQGIAFDDNQASRRAFVKAGFGIAGEKIIDGRNCTVYRQAAARNAETELHAAVY